MTNSKQVVEILRQKASSDPVTNAVLHMWALRKRARHEITVGALHARMKREGFIHDKQSYEPLLKLLGQLGLGTVQVNSKGRVVALKGVQTTLQSLGTAVLSPKGQLKQFKQKHKFSPLMLTREAEAPKLVKETKTDAQITVQHASKSMTFPVPSDASDEDIAHIVSKFLKFSASL